MRNLWLVDSDMWHQLAVARGEGEETHLYELK